MRRFIVLFLLAVGRQRITSWDQGGLGSFDAPNDRLRLKVLWVVHLGANFNLDHNCTVYV